MPCFNFTAYPPGMGEILTNRRIRVKGLAKSEGKVKGKKTSKPLKLATYEGMKGLTPPFAYARGKKERIYFFPAYIKGESETLHSFTFAFYQGVR